MQLLGIDIGGSGIKGALVDTAGGQLSTDRQRIETPPGAVPKAVAEVVAQIAQHFDWKGPIGCTFPAIIHHGVTLSAANVDSSWIGTDAQKLFEEATGLPVQVINDADAAGIAEMEFGAGRGRKGLVIMLTFGTGIGSAMFMDGILLPNSELGHLEVRGKDAEHRASVKVKEEKDLSWKKWSERVNEFLAKVEFLFSPDLLIIGGGISKRHEKFLPLLNTRAEIIPAQFFNDAGIIGAAMAAKKLVNPQASAEETPPAATQPITPTTKPKTSRSSRTAKAAPASASAETPAPTESVPVHSRTRRTQKPATDKS